MNVRPVELHQDVIQLMKQQKWKKTIRMLEKYEETVQIKLWIGYSYFHNQQYQEALEIYNQIRDDDQINDLHVLKACCLYALKKFNEAYSECQLQKQLTPLTIRLLCNLEIKQNSSIQQSQFEHILRNSFFDNLCRASLQYHRQKYKEALLSFENCFQQKVDMFSLYASFCLYKQEFFEYSLELLQTYLNCHPNSLIGLNLQTCIYYQLQNKPQYHKIIKKIQQLMKYNNRQNDIIQHNIIIMKENKSQYSIFKQLMNSLPEAKLNYIIFCLQNDSFDDANEILHFNQPKTNFEKALLAAYYTFKASQEEGFINSQNQNLYRALYLYKEVGNSDIECDTILGRQCLASYYFLTQEYQQYYVYLESIEQYCQENDIFRWNYALANYLSSNFLQAENYLSLIQDDKIKLQETYFPLMYKLLIYNNKAEYAWLLYLNSEQQFNFDQMIKYLTVIGNTSYSRQAFFISTKAFDRLNSLQMDNWQHKYQSAIIGSVAGLFYFVTIKTQSFTNLKEAISILLKSCKKQNIEKLMNLIHKWCRLNHYQL